MAEDLQAAYVFLLDRHNRGDFNLAKLGVIALGEGANLAVAWAYQPGAAVSTEGRASDLNALVLLSPFPEGSGYVPRPRPGLARPAGPPGALRRRARTTPPRTPVEVGPKALVERRPAQQGRALPLVAPRLQAAAAGAQGHRGHHAVPRDDHQAPPRRVGAPLQPDPRHRPPTS